MNPDDSDEQLEDDIRELLLSIGVCRRDLDLTPAELARTDAVAAAALARIVDTAPRSAGRSAPRGRRGFRLAGVLGAAAALAIVLVFVRPWGAPDHAVAQTPAMLHFQFVKDGGVPTAGKPARQALESLSLKALQQPAPGAGPIQRVVLDGWWSSSDESDGAKPGASVIIPNRVENYYFPDGTMRSIGRAGTPLDETGHITDKKGNWSDDVPNTDDTFDSSDPGPDFPATLSTAPATLFSQLIDDESQCLGHRAACLLGEVVSLHQSYVLLPELNSALWQALAEESGIGYLGTTRDRLGRAAVAFTLVRADPSYQDLFFADPATGQWLASETILLKKSLNYDYTPPAVVEITAVAESERITAQEVPQ